MDSVFKKQIGITRTEQSRKERSLGFCDARVPVMVLSLHWCKTIFNFPDVSKPQFPYLYNGYNVKQQWHGFAGGIKYDNAFKVLSRAWPRVSTQYMLAIIHRIVVWQLEVDCIGLGRMTFILSSFKVFQIKWALIHFMMFIAFSLNFKVLFLYWKGSNYRQQNQGDS